MLSPSRSQYWGTSPSFTKYTMATPCCAPTAVRSFLPAASRWRSSCTPFLHLPADQLAHGLPVALGNRRVTPQVAAKRREAYPSRTRSARSSPSGATHYEKDHRRKHHILLAHETRRGRDGAVSDAGKRPSAPCGRPSTAPASLRRATETRVEYRDPPVRGNSDAPGYTPALWGSKPRPVDGSIIIFSWLRNNGPTELGGARRKPSPAEPDRSTAREKRHVPLAPEPPKRFGGRARCSEKAGPAIHPRPTPPRHNQTRLPQG